MAETAWGGYLLTNDECVLYLHEGCRDEGLKDYKFMCFDGEQKCAFVCSERFTSSGLKVTFYDTDWEVMPFERHYPKSEHPVAKPATYDEMAALAEELSKDIPFARVDFYEVNGASYFGELTLYPGNGMEEFSPSEWDERFGEWLKLPERDIR